MPVKFACPCGKHLVAPESKIGQSTRCPRCGEVVVVPGGPVPTLALVPPQAEPTIELAPPEAGAPERATLPAAPPAQAAARGEFQSVWELLGAPPGAGQVALQPEGDPPAAPAGAKSLGRYAVGGVLGKGGMGEVLLVHDPEVNRELAAAEPSRSEGEPGAD
ncbi:MAG: hypothetical protein HY720_04805 [Planctomycetes bacterium]|nr:hypothetical protein [Planctomycetota bacterium]